jgi:hypothetical protein
LFSHHFFMQPALFQIHDNQLFIVVTFMSECPQCEILLRKFTLFTRHIGFWNKDFSHSSINFCNLSWIFQFLLYSIRSLLLVHIQIINLSSVLSYCVSCGLGVDQVNTPSFIISAYLWGGKSVVVLLYTLKDTGCLIK